MFKVLICGDRRWNQERPIQAALLRLKKKHGDLLVIEGGAPGADRLAQKIAHEMNLHVAEVPALWPTRFRSAGPQRNEAMLSLEPDLVLAFHKFIDNSKGTADMVARARKSGIPVKVLKGRSS
jgi:hypothetical protein